MLPGHDAIGHDAVGHPPGGVQTFTFAANTGVFTLSGNIAIFRTQLVSNSGVFTLTGQNGIFTTQLIAATGLFALTGFSLTVKVTWLLSKGSFAWTGYNSTPTFDRAFTFKRFITEDHSCKVYTTRVEQIKHT